MGADLEAVSAYEYPPPAWRWDARPSNYGFLPVPPDPEIVRKDLATATAATVDEVLGTQRSPAVRTRVVKGHAASVLIDAARGAELLVVGRRGHGGFADLLLGSVGRHCVEHAACPVVVVPIGPGAPAAAGG